MAMLFLYFGNRGDLNKKNTCVQRIGITMAFILILIA